MSPEINLESTRHSAHNLDGPSRTLRSESEQTLWTLPARHHAATTDSCSRITWPPSVPSVSSSCAIYAESAGPRHRVYQALDRSCLAAWVTAADSRQTHQQLGPSRCNKSSVNAAARIITRAQVCDHSLIYKYCIKYCNGWRRSSTSSSDSVVFKCLRGLC